MPVDAFTDPCGEGLGGRVVADFADKGGVDLLHGHSGGCGFAPPGGSPAGVCFEQVPGLGQGQCGPAGFQDGGHGFGQFRCSGSVTSQRGDVPGSVRSRGGAHPSLDGLGTAEGHAHRNVERAGVRGGGGTDGTDGRHAQLDPVVAVGPPLDRAFDEVLHLGDAAAVFGADACTVPPFPGAGGGPGVGSRGQDDGRNVSGAVQYLGPAREAQDDVAGSVRVFCKLPAGRDAVRLSWLCVHALSVCGAGHT